jgi:glycosyltransferase involved in cell wall biosynthesis
MFMVLSEAYLPLLRNFIHVGNSNKQGVLVNPITIDVKGYSYCRQEKQKEIVFCGRVDFNQKRVHRLIEVWSFLETKFPDWQLTIVGDGDAKKDLENQVNLMKLKSVRFEGFRKPLKYYRRASILALTSEYEGFPLVLAECMSFGVVPCVYDSFAAVHDIIEDDVNGLIIEKENGYFSAEKMAMRLAEIMSDEQKLDMIAQKSIETSKRYSIDSVYEQWMENLTQLTKKDQTTKVEYY